MTYQEYMSSEFPPGECHDTSVMIDEHRGSFLKWLGLGLVKKQETILIDVDPGI